MSNSLRCFPRLSPSNPNRVQAAGIRIEGRRRDHSLLRKVFEPIELKLAKRADNAQISASD